MIACNKQSNIILWLFFPILFTYIILRAYFLSFVHDESLTYTIITGDATWIDTANNHVLNTYFMKWCCALFGESELSLRLPNVLAFGLYCYASFSILKEFNNKWLLLLGSSILFLNPFLTDFFSLARGYGLSLGFMLMSLMFLFKIYIPNLNFKSLVTSLTLSLLFSSLAVYSNLGMINYHITIFVICIARCFLFFKEKHNTTTIEKILLVTVLLISLKPIFEGISLLLLLNQKHQLYYGENTLIATVESLIINSLYFTKCSKTVIICIKYLIILLQLTALLIMILKKDYRRKIALIIILNSLITVGLITEHYLFGAKFPSGRTALFFIPIFGMLICYVFSNLFQHYSNKNILWIISVLLISIPLIFNFCININLKHTKTWQYDAHTKDVMAVIKSITDSLKNKSSISNHLLFEPTINYYIKSKKIKLYTNNKLPENLNSDFVYQLDYKEEKGSTLKVLSKYLDINSTLLINNKPKP